MRLQLTVQRQSIPPVKVLWTVNATRPTSNAPGASFTISQFLEQVNEIIPLEADEWGLEDYAVEVRGFECLHFSELQLVLKEDDEVCIRPLQTSDLRFRRISGRHQITSDGRHLIDGVAFGRPFLRRSERPALRIPPRKRRRVTYDAEDDDDTGDLFSDRQVMAPAGSNEAQNIYALADEEDDDGDGEDDDFVVDEDGEQDLTTELQEIAEDLQKIGDKEGGGVLAITNGAENGATGAEKPRRVTRSQRLGGLGLQGPALLELVDENGRPYPGAYNNPLLDFYSQDDASVAQAGPRRKRRKTDGTIGAREPTPPGPSTSSGALAPQRRRESSASLKNVRFQDDSQATPPTTILAPEDSEDTEDEDFELSTNEDGEVDESDKENAEPRLSETSSDNMSSEHNTSSSDTSEDSDSDESTSSSASSSSSSSGSDTQINVSSDVSSSLQDDVETSSSGSSSDGNISESEDEVHLSPNKQSGLRSKVAGSKANATKPLSDFPQVQTPPSKPKANQIGKKVPSERVLDVEQAASPHISVPPRQGLYSTYYRNKRRRIKKKYDRLKASGKYADNALIIDREAIDRPYKGKDTTTMSDETRKATNYHINQADDQLESKKRALLESIASGGVDVNAPEIAINDSRNEEPGLVTFNNKSREPSFIPALESPAQKAMETPEKAQQNVDESPSTLLANPKQTEKQHVMAIDEIPETAVSMKRTSTGQSAADSPPSAKSSRPRAKVDLASSRRMLFGALGLRTPKTKEDEKALQMKLMKDIKPVKNFAVETETIAKEAALGDGIDDESWRDRINLRAVECCQEGIQLSTPPFPFVQRWDPQQQRGYKAGKGKNSSRNKKRKRKYQQQDYEDIEQQWTGPPAKHQKFDTTAEVNEFSPYQIGEPEDAMQNDGTSADKQNMDDLETAADAIGDYEEDLPKIPEDLGSCETLTKDSCVPGTVLAFKMLDMSQETNWQPRISKYRTALVNEFLEDGMILMTLAHRDRPNQKVIYHSETGERLYSKFEMPGYESQGESDNGHLMASFAELIEPKVIRMAKPKESEEKEQAIETSVKEHMAVDTVDDSLSTVEPAEINEAVQNSQDIDDENADESWEGIEDTAVVDDTEMTETSDFINPIQEDGLDQVKYPDLPEDTDMVEMADAEKGPASPLARSQFDGGNPVSERSSPQSAKNTNEEVREEIFNLISDAGWRSSLNPEVEEKRTMQSEVTPIYGHVIPEVHVPSSAPTSPRLSGFDMDSGLIGEIDAEQLPAGIAEMCPGPAEVPDSITEPVPNLSNPRKESLSLNDAIDEWAPEAMDDEDSALWDTQANQQIASEGMSSHASTPKPPKVQISPHKRHARVVKSISPPRLPRSKISPRISSTAPESKGKVNGTKTNGQKHGKLLDSASSSDELPSLEKVFAARIASLDHPSSSIPLQNNNHDGPQSTNDANEEIKSEDSIFDIFALPNHSTQTPSTQNTQKLHTQKRALRSPPVDDSSLQYISDDASGFVLGSQIPEGSQIIDLTLSSDPVEPSESAYEGDSSLPNGPGWMNKVRRGTRERSVGRGGKKGFKIHGL